MDDSSYFPNVNPHVFSGAQLVFGVEHNGNEEARMFPQAAFDTAFGRTELLGVISQAKCPEKRIDIRRQGYCESLGRYLCWNS